MPEYTVPALHNDYKHIMAQKLYASQKKGVKTNDFYLTKRGYYMDYELKIAKGIPSSGKIIIIKRYIKNNSLGTQHKPSWKENCWIRLEVQSNILFTNEWK